MKHAFLIIAHKNWNQLILLLRQIDALNHDIFIHVDKKAKGVPVKRIKEAVRYSKICIYSEYSVFGEDMNRFRRNCFYMEKPMLLDMIIIIS